MRKSKFHTINEYIKTFPEDVQIILEKISQTVREAAPQIDVVNPTESDLLTFNSLLNPDNKALENYENTRIFFENLKDWRADLSPTAELSLPLLHHLVSYEYTTRI
jgi:hypothetical protein